MRTETALREDRALSRVGPTKQFNHVESARGSVVANVIDIDRFAI